MENRASQRLFFFIIFFICLLFWFSNGAEVSVSFHARGSSKASSSHTTMSVLKKKNVSEHVLYLNRDQIQSPSSLRTHLVSLLRTRKIRSVVARIGSGESHELTRLFTELKSVHSVLTSFHYGHGIKLCLVLPLNFLENLSVESERKLCRVLRYINEVIVETTIDESSFLTSNLHCDHNIPIVTVKKSPIRNPKEAHRILIAESESETKTRHDTIFPTTPTIVTVNPSPTTITNPDTPIVTLPLTAPATNPVTAPIVMNPVTTYPSPVGNAPTVTPVNPPAGNSPGQTWCVARTGVAELALQAALDYACGGGADCSQIQTGQSCFNPNSLQNHASYAFNSFYQKNPVATSCDFGGAAALVNSNPSVGSCIYPTSASSSAASSPLTVTPVTPTPITPAPITTTPVTPAPITVTPVSPAPITVTPTVQTPSTPIITNPAAGIPTPSWTTTPGTGSSPPSVMNTSTGTGADFGSDIPPGFTNSSSKATALRPFLGTIVLATTLIFSKIVLM